MLCGAKNSSLSRETAPCGATNSSMRRAAVNSAAPCGGNSVRQKLRAECSRASAKPGYIKPVYTRPY